MISNDPKQKTNRAMTRLIPSEFLELNWRVGTFILMIVLGIYLMMIYPMTDQVNGLIDPFYSPTVLILPFIGLFRLTCYAYRKDYHRHIFNHPRACEIGFRAETKGREYTGETRLFRIENLHRWFMYFAILILPFFFYDIYLAIVTEGGITLGIVLLGINAIFVTLYTLSCHAVRHLIGGNTDCFSCKHNVRQKLFTSQTKINLHHETLAWISLTLFFLVDLYIRGLQAGVLHNIWLIH